MKFNDMSKIQIHSHRELGEVIYECDAPDMRHALERAVKARVSLRYADLSDADMRHADLSNADMRGANLSGAAMCYADLTDADMRGADLRNADMRNACFGRTNMSGARFDVSAYEQVKRLDQVRAIILDDKVRLYMEYWHSGSDWKSRTCAEEALCNTAHCLAGWLQVCATDPKIRDEHPEIAGFLCAPIAAPLFFSDRKRVLKWLRNREYVAQLAGAA